MLKLRLWSINGWSCNSLEKDQFAFRRDSSPDNPGAKPNAIVFYCRGPKVKNPNGRICTVPIVQGEPDFEKKIHGWDGNWNQLLYLVSGVITAVDGTVTLLKAK